MTSALSSSCKVGFEGTGAGVLHRDHVGVVGPRVAERDLEVALFEHVFLGLEDAHALEHDLEVLGGEQRLDDVGAVERVDAIGPEHALLPLEGAGVSGADEKILEFLDVITKLVHQNA